ncbi:hypothetical protein J2Z37_002141 [Ammoniphilus resinae]|uniref:Methyltransferase n=1 Tax=Ammoniphilus resinae TaxID=861532 RepID=A0ABS4GQI0_9BACL|nr:hypothetical protein [Ammoniphilus resinae]
MVSVADTMMIAISAAALIVGLATLIVAIVALSKKK